MSRTSKKLSFGEALFATKETITESAANCLQNPKAFRRKLRGLLNPIVAAVTDAREIPFVERLLHITFDLQISCDKYERLRQIAGDALTPCGEEDPEKWEERLRLIDYATQQAMVIGRSTQAIIDHCETFELRVSSEQVRRGRLKGVEKSKLAAMMKRVEAREELQRLMSKTPWLSKTQLLKKMAGEKKWGSLRVLTEVGKTISSATP